MKTGKTFKVGDKVTYTNDQGCVFRGHVVTRIMNRPETDCALQQMFDQGKKYLIDTDCYWVPKSAKSLTLEA